MSTGIFRILSLGAKRVIYINSKLNFSKSIVSPMEGGLDSDSHSPARSHYCPTRPVWAVLSPAWPGSRLLRPPGHHVLLHGAHVDAGLSADAGSTWPATPSLVPPSRCPRYQPSSSRVTEMCHHPRHDKWSRVTWVLLTIPATLETPIPFDSTGGIKHRNWWTD